MDTIACHLALESQDLSPSSTLHSPKDTLPLIFSMCDEEDAAVIRLEEWVPVWVGFACDGMVLHSRGVASR